MANLLAAISVLMISSTSSIVAEQSTHSRGDLVIGEDNMLLIYKDYPWTWPAVACADGFDTSAGEAACLEMGYTGLKQIQELGNQPDYPFYQSIKCPAVSNYTVNGERNILRCQFGANLTKEAFSIATCPRLFLVAIHCNNDRLDGSPYDGQVFLAKNVDNGVLTTPDGFLSIHVNGKIGHQYICCDGQFEKKKLILANSACRQLGYTNAANVKCTNNNFVDKTGLSIINYTCDKSSIPCFSNCFEEDNWKITNCQIHGHVYIECEYNESQANLFTSGTESMCRYVHDPDATNNFDKATAVIVISILSLLVLVLIIVVTYLACHIRPIRRVMLLPVRCCRCIRRRRREQQGNEEEPLQEDRPVEQGCFN